MDASADPEPYLWQCRWRPRSTVYPVPRTMFKTGWLSEVGRIVDTAGKIVMRIRNSKGLPLKIRWKRLTLPVATTSSGTCNYGYTDLQLDFNGMSLFARYVSDGNGGDTDALVFNGANQSAAVDHTLDIYTSTGEVLAQGKYSLKSALSAMAFQVVEPQP